MNYQSLIASIRAAIYNNGAELITGNVLQGVLLDMVNALDSAGATYGGTITPASAAPTDLDQPTVYLALEAGAYTDYLDSGGNPIVTTGPALITYNGGASLVFSKTDLPSGGTGATIITNDGSEGDSVAIRLTDNQFYKRSFRIDIIGVYTGGSVIQRIGSLVVECYDNSTERAHGYYYGDTLADILSEVAVYQDDTDPDTFYLMLKHDSSLDSVTFAITPLEGGEVDAFITNAGDDHTKVSDATITPVELSSNKVSTLSGNETSTTKYPNTKAVADAISRYGIVSHTREWSIAADGAREYSISSPVWGYIPFYLIDSASDYGVVFNQTSGYFEVNDLTDISAEELRYSMTYGILRRELTDGNTNNYLCNYQGLTTLVGNDFGEAVQLTAGQNFHSTNCRTFRCGKGNSVRFRPGNSGYQFSTNYFLISIKPIIDVSTTTISVNTFSNLPSLEFVQVRGAKQSFGFASSARLSKDSLLYMINNEAATSTIVITLHPSVYAKTQTGGEWKADVDAALANHPNVQLGQ